MAESMPEYERIMKKTLFLCQILLSCQPSSSSGYSYGCIDYYKALSGPNRGICHRLGNLVHVRTCQRICRECWRRRLALRSV